MKKNSYTAEFKLQTVLEVLREERTLSEIAADRGVNPNQIRNWKKEFLDKAGSIFGSKNKQEIARKEKVFMDEREAMLATIGQLTMERDFLKKKSIQVFGPDYEKKFTR
ncbi:transposase [Clostridia bacterium]|nr:transposase [Clostridia bacterium]